MIDGRETDRTLTQTVGGVHGDRIDADLLGPILSFLGNRALGGVPTPFDLNLIATPGSISVGVRRLHDTNRSGWWLFITLMLIVGNLLAWPALRRKMDRLDPSYAS